jgi:hypothetical protein
MPKTIRPIMHIDWLRNRLCEKEEYKDKWWVIWYEKDTGHSAGMDYFDNREAAVVWNGFHPPRPIEGPGDGNFDSSEIFHS